MTNTFDWNALKAIPDIDKGDGTFDWNRLPSASSMKNDNNDSFPKELGRGFIEGVTPQLNSEASQNQRMKEAQASPEELVNLVETGDVLPSYTDIPNREEIESFLEKTLGMKGESSKAKYGQRIGRSLGTLAQTGAFTPSAIAAMSGGAALGELVEQKSGDPLLGLLAELGGAGFTGLLEGGIKGVKNIKPNQLVEQGKRLGLQESTTAPLVMGEKSKSIFGKLALKGKKTENFLKKTKEDLGTAFEELNKKGSSLPNLTDDQTLKVIDKFTDVTKQIKKTLANTPDEKNALLFIDEAIDNLYSRGTNPGELENFYRTINSKINWNNMSRGDIYKKQIKNIISETFQEINPEFSKDFNLLNNFYSRYFDLEKKLGQSDLQKVAQTFNDMRRVGQVGWGLVTLNPGVLLEPLGEKGFQIYARESLINPTIQKLNQALINSAKKGAHRESRIIINKTLDYLKKQYPEEFEDVNFNQE